MWQLDFEGICRKLQDGNNFSFARYGDGEWKCILGEKGENCDNHPYTHDLGLALSLALCEPQSYYLGMQPKSQRDIKSEIDKWLSDMELNIEWCNADILHNASIDDRLGEFFKAMQGRRIIFVAPERLNAVAMKISAIHIPVQLYNVWRWYRQIYGDILDQIDKNAVILYSMSMAAKVLIAKLHDEYGDTITQVDCGSVFDPYCGYRTRRYHAEIIKRLKI